ncbi:MAG: hypothetical protein AB7V27_14105 [Candidatus Binatia bacterium]
MRIATESGLSLLEVLASVTVFALVAAGMGAQTIATIQANSSSRATTAAAALIQDKIEQLRALDPAANPAALRPGTYSDPQPLNEVGAAGGRFTRSWTITADVPRRGLSQVVVAVSWKDPIPRTLQSTTFLCRTATCS